MEELNSVTTKVKPEEARLARQIIESFEGPLDLATYKDEYQEGLKAIIDAKIAGQEIVAPAAEAPAKVVNLMDALRKSLDAVITLLGVYLLVLGGLRLVHAAEAWLERRASGV